MSISAVELAQSRSRGFGTRDSRRSLSAAAIIVKESSRVLHWLVSRSARTVRRRTVASRFCDSRADQRLL